MASPDESAAGPVTANGGLGDQHAIAQALPFLDGLEVWVCITDVQDHTILYANRHLRRMFGDVVGSTCWQTFQRGMGGPCPQCSDSQLFAPDGTAKGLVSHEVCNSVTGRWYTCNSQGIQWTDGRPARLEILVDITERKLAEDTRTRRLGGDSDSRRLADLEYMAGGIAHDFNNLLMGIVGHAELAAMKPDDVAAVRHHLAEVAATSRRATDLTEKLLAFAGAGKYHVEPVDVVAEIADLAHRVAAGLPPNVELTTAIQPDLPVIALDRQQIRQAVEAGAANSVEAIGDRPGHIHLVARTATLDGATSSALGLRRQPGAGTHLVVTIEDDGPGVDPEVLDRAFDPFVSTRAPGRGLGLAAVEGILRSHHGSAGLTSTPGRGASLHLLVPLDHRPGTVHQIALPGPAGPSDTDGAPTVLLVEDDETVREATGAMLEVLGATVIGAENGREALDLVRRAGDRINLVLSDFLMPELNGLETLEAMRSLRPQLPIILSSGFSEDEVVPRSMAGAYHAFIKKPYRFADLKQAVAPLLRS